MGLFKKKPETYEEKVNKAMKLFKTEAIPVFFPGKFNQCDRIIRSMAFITNNNIDDCNYEIFGKYLRAYVDCSIRKNMSGMLPSQMTISLKVNHSDIFPNEDIIKKIAIFCAINMLNNQYKVVDNGHLKVLEEISKTMEFGKVTK